MALAHRRPYGIYRWLANAPRLFYRLGLGWLFGHGLVQITHRGRKSGQVRRTILEVLHYDPRTREVLVVSGWEGKTDWYRNIEREPALQVRIGRVQYRPVQEFLSPEETAQLILTLFRQRPRESASLGHSWESIPMPRMRPCVLDWKPSFGECVSALLARTSKK
jgi:deazaflavin-dependent oxidoreductase (nitroreductase family)